MSEPREPAIARESAAASRDPQWWSSHRISDEYRDFVEAEARASRVAVYHALCVPGILQTEAYARAATAAIVQKDPADPYVEARVSLRLRRQRDLEARAAGEHPPELVAILDEAVLRRPIGGAAVLREQVDRLLDLARQDWITLVVLPLALDGHPGLGGSFELLSFPGPPRPDLLFVESAIVDFVITEPTVTATYRETIAVLSATGLTGAAAVEQIARLREEI
jgi:hypothetical protein